MRRRRRRQRNTDGKTNSGRGPRPEPAIRKESVLFPFRIRKMIITPTHRVHTHSSFISLPTSLILSLPSLVPDSTACGDPEQPVSSLVTRSEPTRVRYSCVKGYRLEGGAERVCLTDEGGRWEGEPPRCIGGFVSLSSLKLRNSRECYPQNVLCSVAYITCISGYRAGEKRGP